MPLVCSALLRNEKELKKINTEELTPEMANTTAVPFICKFNKLDYQNISKSIKLMLPNVTKQNLMYGYNVVKEITVYPEIV